MIAAAASDKVGASGNAGVIIESNAYGLEEDWRTYHSYFSDINGFPT